MESRMPKYRFVTDDGKKVDRGEDTLEFPNDAQRQTPLNRRWQTWSRMPCRMANR